VSSRGCKFTLLRLPRDGGPRKDRLNEVYPVPKYWAQLLGASPRSGITHDKLCSFAQMPDPEQLEHRIAGRGRDQTRLPPVRSPFPRCDASIDANTDVLWMDCQSCTDDTSGPSPWTCTDA
jgi:hypothetical protein